jgi:hypothetical protein
MAARHRVGRYGEGAPRIAALASLSGHAWVVAYPAIIATHVSPANLAQQTLLRPRDVGMVCLVAGHCHGLAPGQSAGPHFGVLRRWGGAAQGRRRWRRSGNASAHHALRAVLVDRCATDHVGEHGGTGLLGLCAACRVGPAPSGQGDRGGRGARAARAGLSPLPLFFFRFGRLAPPRNCGGCGRAIGESACPFASLFESDHVL